MVLPPKLFCIFVKKYGFVIINFDNYLHFCFCFSNSLDWIGYDEKFKGKRLSNNYNSDDNHGNVPWPFITGIVLPKLFSFSEFELIGF